MNENMNENYHNQSRGHSGLIAAVSVLSAIVIAAIIFGILLLTGTISLSSSMPSECQMYVIDNAYIRNEPSDTSSVLIGLSPGAALTYHKDANSIYASVTYVNSEAQYNGYIEKSMLSLTKPTLTEATTMYVANVKYSIYFRSAPIEDKSNIICEIPLGTPITFMENADTVFAKISYNNQEGYVKREYLSAAAPQATAQSVSGGNTTVAYYVYVANVKNSIYLRQDPSENQSNIICTIPLGTRIGFIESAGATFSKVAYNGKYGYVKTEYLSTYAPSSAATSTSMTVCNVKTSIYLRSNPTEDNNNIICEIPVGSRVEYVNSGNGTFYKIKWNGYTGYSKSMYLRFD